MDSAGHFARQPRTKARPMLTLEPPARLAAEMQAQTQLARLLNPKRHAMKDHMGNGCQDTFTGWKASVRRKHAQLGADWGPIIWEVTRTSARPHAYREPQHARLVPYGFDQSTRRQAA